MKLDKDINNWLQSQIPPACVYIKHNIRKHFKNILDITDNVAT